MSGKLFVVGYMHSGTTLLQNILGKSPEIFMIGGETKFFELLNLGTNAREKYRFGWTSKCFEKFMPQYLEVFSKHYLPEHNISKQKATEKFANIFDELCQITGKRFWLEKTPSHAIFINDICNSYPDAKLIFIVRDIRDVYASKKQRVVDVEKNFHGTGKLREKKLQKNYNPLFDALSARSFVEACLTGLHEFPDRLHVVRYEDLVGDPEVEVRKICQFAGLGYDVSMLQVATLNSAYAQKTDRIDAASVGRYKGKLCPEELWIIQKVSARVMRMFNYEEDVVNVPLSAKLRIVGSSLLRLAINFYGKIRLGGRDYFINYIMQYARRARQLKRTRS